MKIPHIIALKLSKTNESKSLPLASKETADIGVSYNYSREDHVHPLEEATTTTLGSVKISSSLPLANAATAKIGTSTKYSREDHVHPLIQSSYLKVRNDNGQTTNLAVNGILTVDTAELATGSLFSFDANSKITIQPTTNIVKIIFHLGKVDFSTSGSLYFKLYNQTSSSLVGNSAGSETVSSSNNIIGSSDVSYSFIPSVQTVLYAKITSVTGTPVSIHDSWIEVIEIPNKY